MSELPEPSAFGAEFQEFVRSMAIVAARRPSPLGTRVGEHLSTDPGELPTTAVEFGCAEQANLQLARRAWLAAALDDRDRPTADDLRAVLDELLEQRSTLTRRLLGQPSDAPGADAGPTTGAMSRALAAAGLPIPTEPAAA